MLFKETEPRPLRLDITCKHALLFLLLPMPLQKRSSHNVAVGEQTAPEAREPGALENVVRESGCREEMGDVVFVGKMSNSPAGWREHFVFKGV